MPTKKDDGLNAVKRYQAKCDAIMIRPMKADGEKIRAAASAAGVSVTQYIMKAVFEYMENHPDEKKGE